MNCCKNYKGKFPHNQEINLDISTDEIGSHVLEFTGINGTKLHYSISITDPVTETINIPAGIVNESMYYCLVIKKPSGENITEAECENFCFETYIATNTTCGDLCEPDSDVLVPIG